MSAEDPLATKQVTVTDNKLSKLETILNQSRIGFYTILGTTVAAFTYGVYIPSPEAIEIGDKLLLPLIGWMGMYVANLVNKKED